MLSVYCGNISLLVTLVAELIACEVVIGSSFSCQVYEKQFNDFLINYTFFFFFCKTHQQTHFCSNITDVIRMHNAKRSIASEE